MCKSQFHFLTCIPKYWYLPCYFRHWLLWARLACMQYVHFTQCPSLWCFNNIYIFNSLAFSRNQSLFLWIDAIFITLSYSYMYIMIRWSRLFTIYKTGITNPSISRSTHGVLKEYTRGLLHKTLIRRKLRLFFTWVFSCVKVNGRIVLTRVFSFNQSFLR